MKRLKLLFTVSALLFGVVLVTAPAAVAAPTSAVAATRAVIGVAFSNQNYNRPCDGVNNSGCGDINNLRWDLGNCAQTLTPGYTWRSSLFYVNGDERFNPDVAHGMSSVWIQRGTGCNLITLENFQGDIYTTCVGDAAHAWGISWFGPGYNDNITRVTFQYISGCGPRA